MSGVPGKVSTGAGISLGADGFSTSSGTFSAGTTPPITGALNIDASGYGGTFLAATNTSGSSMTMSLDATTNTMTVNGNVVVTGTVSEAAVSEGPLTITGGTVTVSTPFLQAAQSWNAAGVTFTGMKVNVTDTASASGSLLQDFQVGGVSKFSITKAGAVTAASNLSVATGAVYQINGTSVLSATTLGSSVVTSSLTTVGTLSAGAIPASLVTAGTFGAGAYTFPGALAITGALTGVTTASMSGLLTSTLAVGKVFTADGGTTNSLYQRFSNTGGSVVVGLESSTGGSIITGTSAYAAIFGTDLAKSIQFCTNNAVNLTIASGGAATFSNSLAINGAFTGATTGAFSSTITNTSGSLYLKAVSSGTGLGSATYQGWYLPDGTTPRAYLGYTSTNDPTFHVGPNESGGTLVLHYGAYSSGLTIGSTGAVAIPGTLAVTGAATFGAGGTSVVMNATSTYNAIRFNQSGTSQGFIGSDYGQAMCTTSANGDMVLRADVSGTILFAASTTQIGKLTTGTFALSDGQTIQWASSSNRVFFNGGAFRIDVNGSQYLGISTAGAVTAAGVYSTTVGATNRDLYIDNTGLIGYVSSIRASKTNITPLTDTSWLDALTPVAFNYRKKDEDGAWTDEANTPLEYGLIAEEVESVNTELVFYDETEDGLALRGVSYSKLMIPLLQRVQALTARVAALEAH